MADFLTPEQRKRLGPYDFGPSGAAIPPVARAGADLDPGRAQAIAERRQLLAERRGLPKSAYEFGQAIREGFGDTFGEAARGIGTAAGGVVQGGADIVRGVTGGPRERPVAVAAPVATPAPVAGTPQGTPPVAPAPAPKLGLARDFEGQLGSFDISQEGGVQVIRGPSIARTPPQGGAGVISPLDMAKYNIDRVNLARGIARDARTADKDATAQAMDLARFIQNDDTLGEMRPTAQRLALTLATPEKPPLFIASLISELVPQLTETDPVARQKQLQEMLMEKLAMAQVQP